MRTVGDCATACGCASLADDDRLEAVALGRPCLAIDEQP